MKISLVIPCFNEQEALPIFYEETSKILKEMHVEYELIFVNDGSRGEEYIVVKYIQKSEREGYVKLVSQNPHHADKDIEISRIRAIALVKASIRMNSIR